MTVEEQKLELDRQRLLVEQARLRVERRKVATETVRHYREKRFASRNSAALISASVVFLSAVVTFFGIINTIDANRSARDLTAVANNQANEERDRRWKIEAATFIARYRDQITSLDLAEKVPLRAIMALSFPEAIIQTFFNNLEAQSPNPAIAKFWKDADHLIDAQKLAEVNVPQAATPVTTTGQVVLPGNAAVLAAQLNGPARRALSNALVEQYVRDPRGTIALLVGAIVPPGQSSTYRVNLYILVTLARIKGGWTGTQAQRNAVAAIVNSSERSDPTYKKWADQARAAEISS